MTDVVKSENTENGERTEVKEPRPRSSKPGFKKFFRNKSGRPDRAQDNMDSPCIHGVAINTRNGSPKYPVALLNEIVMKRLPPLRIVTRMEDDDDAFSVCIVGHLITEAHGNRRESRDAVIHEMLNKLSHHCESGYASENPQSPSNASERVNKTAEITDDDKENEPEAEHGKGEGDELKEEETADEKKEHGHEGEEDEKKEVGTPEKAGGKKKVPSKKKPAFARLFDLAREKFPPVKYDVVSILRTPKGPYFVVRCAVKHYATFGEGVGTNGKQKAKVAAAEAMLEKMKMLSPLESQDEDYSLLNPAFIRATGVHHIVSLKDVRRARVVVNRCMKIILSMMTRDPFFNDHFTKAFFGGSFFDRVGSDEDYEILFVFWRSNLLVPVDSGNGKSPPRMRLIGRDMFARALWQMEFTDGRGNVLAHKFADWFNGLLSYNVGRFRDQPDFKVSGEVKKGVFVLKVDERGFHPIEVKLKPCFAYPSLRRLPACAIYPKYLRQALNSEWYAVPERTEVAPPVEGGRPKLFTRWAFKAPAGERAILHDTHSCKPLLRLFMDLNEKKNWGLSFADVKNLFMDEVLLHCDFEIWEGADTASLFMMMLAKLAACFKVETLPTMWESMMPKLPTDQAKKALADVTELQKFLCSAFRRYERLLDTGTVDQKHAVIDDVLAKLHINEEEEAHAQHPEEN